MGDRIRLPNRRISYTCELEFNEQLYLVTAGFHIKDESDIILREVFIKGGEKRGVKVGQDMHCIIDDASVLISIALQFEIPLLAMAKSMSRIPLTPLQLTGLDKPEGDQPQRQPTSIIGAVIDLLIMMQEETKKAVADAK